MVKVLVSSPQINLCFFLSTSVTSSVRNTIVNNVENSYTNYTNIKITLQPLAARYMVK